MDRRPTPEEDVVTCFRDGQVTLRKNRRTEGFTESLKEIGYQGVRKGDLVIHAMDAFAGAIGVSDSDGKSTPVYSVCRPQFDANPFFYAFLLREMSRAGFIQALAKGIRERSTDFRFNDFANLVFPLPPRLEQDAIVAYLDEKLEAINRYLRVKEQEVTLLEERKRALIHRAVTRGLDDKPQLQPSGIPWLPEIPVGWETWKVGHFSRVGNGSTPSRARADYWNGGDYPWLNSASVNKGVITVSDQFVTPAALRECHLPIIPAGSILVAITGQGKTRGTAAFLQFEATINQHIAFITIVENFISSEFLHLLLRGIYSELRAMSDDSGSTKGALTCHDLKQLKIPIPPRQEQNQLVRECNKETDQITTTITRAHSQIERMQEYRTALIAEAVTGKLDVTK